MVTLWYRSLAYFGIDRTPRSMLCVGFHVPEWFRYRFNLQFVVSNEWSNAFLCSN